MFFPAYNEEKNIPILLKAATKVLKRYARKYEILVVVYAGSTDRTLPIVRQWAKKDSRIRLVLQPKEKKGIGYAKYLAFTTAKYPIIFYADSDNQFNLEEFGRFVPYIDDYDIIAGYRQKRQDPLPRIMVSKLYNGLVRILFGAKERDLDCAFRLVKKKVIDSISLNCRTGLATTEILIKARKKGFKIKEIGVTHYPRLHGTPVFTGGGLDLPKPKVVKDIVMEMWGLWKELHLGK